MFHNPLQEYLFNLRRLSSEFLPGCLRPWSRAKSPSAKGYTPVGQPCRHSLSSLSDMAVFVAGKCLFPRRALTAQWPLIRAVSLLFPLNRVIFRAIDPFDVGVPR